MKAYGYCRTSLAPDSKVPSLDAQREACQDYCIHLRATGLPDLMLYGTFFDEDDTFRKPFRERLAGGQLCARLQRGDHVILPRLDRAFRRVTDAVDQLGQWAEQGITVHILDFSVNTGTAHGRLMLAVLSIVADFEAQVSRERRSHETEDEQL